MMYVKYPLSFRYVEDPLAERGIDICHETVRLWRNRFGPLFAAEIRRKRVEHMRQVTQWRWHLDEVYVKFGGEMHSLWRGVDHKGEVLVSPSISFSVCWPSGRSGLMIRKWYGFSGV